MKKQLATTSLIILLGLFAVGYFFRLGLIIYKNGGTKINSWTCNGIEVKLFCRSFLPAKMPTLCTYLCLGKATHKTENEVLNELDFYQEGNGFLDL